MHSVSHHNLLPCALRWACLSLFLALAAGLVRPLSAQTLPYHGTATSSSTLWWITQLGLGPAGEFDVSNSSNTGPALVATTNGSGPALQATAGSGLAANFSGKVKMTGFQLGSSATSGYVLTTDASGNGTWKKLPADVAYKAGAGLALSGTTFSIASGGVVSSMLAAGAVTTPAIAAAAVSTSALADGAVTASKISLPLAMSGSTGAQSPVVQVTDSGNGIAIKGISNSTSGYGLSGSSANGVGGHFDGSIGVYSDGVSDGVYGFASAGPGVVGESSANGSYGGYFDNNNGSGIYASSTFDLGGEFYGALAGITAKGTAAGGDGVAGDSYGDANSVGVYGTSDPYGYGVFGESNSGYGVYGSSLAGLAGGFNGNVTVTGTLTAGAKNFKIDHPLDPANKYLVHSCIESADMKNLYDGVVTLDADGQATIELPDWFEALNKDFRYQLTCIGGFAPVYIAQEIQNNHFQIAGGKPGMKVSWQVTGIRQDAYAKAHPLEVEQDKPQDKKGKFLHPKEWGIPESLGENYEAEQRIHAHQHAPAK